MTSEIGIDELARRLVTYVARWQAEGDDAATFEAAKMLLEVAAARIARDKLHAAKVTPDAPAERYATELDYLRALRRAISPFVPPPCAPFCCPYTPPTEADHERLDAAFHAEWGEGVLVAPATPEQTATTDQEPP